MKTLITAAEVREIAKKNEKRISVDPDAIITPAAWDEARELGIVIEKNAGQPTLKSSQAMGSGPVDPDFLARIVGEVISCLQQKKTRAVEPVEVDSSGLKRIRSEMMVFSGTATGSSGDNVKTCDLFGATGRAGYSTRILTLADASYSREMKVDETWHVLEGAIECTVNGTRFDGKTGDSLFLPAYRMIAISAPERAKVFVVSAVNR